MYIQHNIIITIIYICLHRGCDYDNAKYVFFWLLCFLEFQKHQLSRWTFEARSWVMGHYMDKILHLFEGTLILIDEHHNHRQYCEDSHTRGKFREIIEGHRVLEFPQEHDWSLMILREYTVYVNIHTHVCHPDDTLVPRTSHGTFCRVGIDLKFWNT